MMGAQYGATSGAMDVQLEREVLLSGGRLTPGVVRVGDTVRRPAAATSDFVRQLLRYLKSEGFSRAPEHLGYDGLGRDTFRYIPGDVPSAFRRFDDDQIRAAARLLRDYHDVTRGSELRAHSPVVCHNDPGPNNFVFRDSLPVAIIDFDLAAPGEPVWDLGYMAWAWCISSKSERQPVEVQAAQVRCLIDAYGLNRDDRTRVVDAILARQEWNVHFWSKRLRVDADMQANRARIHEIILWTKQERAFTQAHRTQFVWALIRS
jgi:hypothetical protein